ncbi:g7786 [Coccomyxa elongata]
MNLFDQKFGPPDTGEWYSTRQLSFRPKIVCKRNDENPPIEFTAEQAVRHVASRYGQPTCTLLEALLPTTCIKPYFDFELYSAEEPDTAAILEEQVLPPIQKSLKVDREQVRIASRHGWMKTKEGQRFKVSFRAFVQGKQLHVAEMNTVIGRAEFQGPGWDKGVYPLRGERMMGVVGGVKGKDGDRRVLEPVEPGHPYHEYLIQALDGNEEVMEVLRPKGASRSIARSDMHSVDAAVGHSADKPDWLTITDESMRELASDYMFAAKMKNFKLGKIIGNAIAVLNESEKLRYCMHVETHRSNNASVLFFKDHRVVYKCYSSKCIDQEAKELGTWETKLPSTMDEMTERDLRELDVNLVKVLLAAKEPKKDVLVVQYLNR